jgi:hypothetical protein
MSNVEGRREKVTRFKELTYITVFSQVHEQATVVPTPPDLFEYCCAVYSSGSIVKGSDNGVLQ